MVTSASTGGSTVAASTNTTTRVTTRVYEGFTLHHGTPIDLHNLCIFGIVVSIGGGAINAKSAAGTTRREKIDTLIETAFKSFNGIPIKLFEQIYDINYSRYMYNKRRSSQGTRTHMACCAPWGEPEAITQSGAPLFHWSKLGVTVCGATRSSWWHLETCRAVREQFRDLFVPYGNIGLVGGFLRIQVDGREKIFCEVLVRAQ